MSWISLTTEDLKNYLSGAEYDGLTTAALATGQDADEVAESVIADTIQIVRGYVAGCAQNTLGSGATIPQELKTPALVIARSSIFGRLPGMQALNDDTRQQAVRDAMALLRDVAACRFKLEQPATPTTQVVSGPSVEVVNSRTRTATRETMGGLL